MCAPISRSCATARRSRRAWTNSRSCASPRVGRLPLSRTRRCRSCAEAGVLFALLCVASPAYAQTGSIHGIVLETRGGTPVQRVSIRLRDVSDVSDSRPEGLREESDTSDIRREWAVVNDQDGRFVFDALTPGEYELYVSAVDFILVKRHVTVVAGAINDVTIVLAEGTGTYTETVNVTAGTLAPRREPAVPAEQTLGSREL